MQPNEMFDLQRRSTLGLYKIESPDALMLCCSGIVSGSLCQASKNAGGDIQRAPLNQKSREYFTLPEHDSCREHVRVVERRGGGLSLCLRAELKNGQPTPTKRLSQWERSNCPLDSTRRAHWVD